MTQESIDINTESDLTEVILHQKADLILYIF